MKALTLTQPWATLIAIGAKKVETRSWSTPYRGALAIHAGKGMGPDDWAICDEAPFSDALRGAGITYAEELPRGAVIAMATLTSVLPTEDGWLASLNDKERVFGDYGRGRYMWFLTDVVRLERPIPARGALGLWDWPVEVPDLLRRA